MTISLRGHHLLCVLTYVGKGYTPDFVTNYDAVVARLDREDVEIVAGPDDVCRPLLADAGAHCRLDRVAARDRHALAAVSRLLDREIRIGVRLYLDPATLARLRAGFRADTIRQACRGCEWADLCTAVARTKFQGARLGPAAEA